MLISVELQSTERAQSARKKCFLMLLRGWLARRTSQIGVHSLVRALRVPNDRPAVLKVQFCQKTGKSCRVAHHTSCLFRASSLIFHVTVTTLRRILCLWRPFCVVWVWFWMKTGNALPWSVWHGGKIKRFRWFLMCRSAKSSGKCVKGWCVLLRLY